MMNDRSIRLANVSKTFYSRSKEVKALENVSLSCEPGSFTALIGPSGCGKSTILRLALGLEKADTGTILIGGTKPQIATAGGATGVAFQDSALLPWRNVESNIALPLDVLGKRRSDFSGYIRDLIRLVGLEGFEKSLPGELSSPGILFLDEPFGALDQILRRQMNIELQRIWSESRATTLLVTHGIDEAVFLADRVAVMHNRPGRIVTIIDIPFHRPRSKELFSETAFHKLGDGIAAALHGE